MSALGHKADIGARPRDVGFTPESGHGSARWRCPLRAKSGHRNALSTNVPDRVLLGIVSEMPTCFGYSDN
jgi:hypothetical protein